MKYLILLLISFNVHPIEKDKKLHFVFSSVIGGGATGITKSAWTGFAVCSAFGVGKELIDEFTYGGFSGKDLTYDAGGCAISSWLVSKGIDDVKPVTFNDHGSTGIMLQYKVEF